MTSSFAFFASREAAMPTRKVGKIETKQQRQLTLLGVCVAWKRKAGIGDFRFC